VTSRWRRKGKESYSKMISKMEIITKGAANQYKRGTFKWGKIENDTGKSENVWKLR